MMKDDGKRQLVPEINREVLSASVVQLSPPSERNHHDTSVLSEQLTQPLYPSRYFGGNISSTLYPAHLSSRESGHGTNGGRFRAEPLFLKRKIEVRVIFFRPQLLETVYRAYHLVN